MSWIGDRVSEWGKWWHVRMLYKKFAVCFKNAPISKHGGNGGRGATVVCLYNLFVPKNCLIYSYWFQRGLEIPQNIKLYMYTKLSEKLSNMCKSFVTHIWFHKSLSPPKTFPINRNYSQTVSNHGNSIYLTVTRSAWSHITIYWS